MKLKLFGYLFFCMFGVIYANESCIEYEKCVQEMESSSCAVIDNLFTQARESLEAHEDIMNYIWLNRKEIKDLQNVMSDACVVLSFDCNTHNIIPERLQAYLQTKIRNEVQQLFDGKKIDDKGAKQFFYFSRMICDLSQCTGCGKMIRIIKDENVDALLALKIQQKVQRQEKKKEMRQLREYITVGAYPRK